MDSVYLVWTSAWIFEACRGALGDSGPANQIGLCMEINGGTRLSQEATHRPSPNTNCPNTTCMCSMDVNHRHHKGGRRIPFSTRDWTATANTAIAQNLILYSKPWKKLLFDGRN